MEKYKALDRLLTELDELLNILDKENLSSYAIMKKEMVSDILRIYVSNSSSCDEEYISMNKLVLTDTDGSQGTLNEGSLANGSSEQHLAPPQKSLPDLPPPKFIPDKISLFGIRTAVTLESYYEEAEPYAASTIEDGEAVSSSYESYDEEESNKGKGTAHLHQWPSTEASIELMKDALMCAFLWRKKWLGQWAKQLCVIKDNRLMCYKSSKDQSALLDVSLIGCTVTYKEKQVRKKEHKLKIVPASADVIVLGMQSKDQAEQWLKVIQDISGLLTDGVFDSSPLPMESQRLTPLKGEVSDRCSAASESGSSTDGHPENPETKEVKKKGGSGLKLSNIMNIGRKKSSSIESSEKTLETSNYLNVLIQSQWKSRYCCIKDGQLHFYQDKNKSKVASQSVCLAGCEIVPQPSQDHLYSFQILHSGEPLVTLEAKSSEEMGHWLGLLMSESGSKTNLEDFNYDYVDAERVSCIISAAKNSYFLMQRKYSEPNTYIDNPRGGRSQEDDLYDDVDVSDILDEDPTPEVRGAVDKTYLEVMPSRSFLHCAGVKNLCKSRTSSPGPEKANNKKDKEGKGPENVSSKEPEPPQPVPETANEEPDKSLLQAPADPEVNAQAVVTASPQMNSRSKEKMKVVGPALESKLGKNRTEAEAKRFTEEKEKLEQEREEIRTRLTELRKEKRELKAIIAACTDKNLLTSFEEKLKSREEECKEQENRRVDLELCIVEVKENLKKAELGPFTLGTTVDTTVLDSSINVKCSSPTPISDLTPVNAAVTLKSRPLTILTTGKGNVLQKAKEWEQKSAS